MNIEGVPEHIEKECELAHQLMDAFIAADTSQEFARVLLVSRMKITYGHASDVLEAYEKLTGKVLRR